MDLLDYLIEGGVACRDHGVVAAFAGPFALPGDKPQYARDRSVDVTDRRGAPLRDNLARRLLGSGINEPIPRAEVSQHGLDGDPGAPGDVLERDLVVKPLYVEIEDGAEDSPPGRRRRLRARLHPVGTGSRSCGRFHVSGY